MANPSNRIRVLIACLCAVGVIFVLISPAFDELPSTPPHAALSGMVPALAVVPLLLLPLLIALYDPTWLPHSVVADDLISWNCTRLC